MDYLIGFNLISLAITIFAIMLFGFELELKEKIAFIISEILIMGLLTWGCYLMCL